MNKLFKQWKSDFDSFWDKLPKTGRIFIGVLGSFCITLTSLNIWITPQRKELESLAKQAPHASEIILSPDKDLDIMEARTIAKKLSLDLNKLKLQVSELKSGATYLKPEYHAEILLDIDKLAASSGLSIRSRVDSVTLEKRKKSVKTRGRGIKKTSKTTEDKKAVGHFVYCYEMVGDFKNTYAFLYRLKKINGYFEFDNIEIERFEETEKALKAMGLDNMSGLTIQFDVIIYYL